MAIHLMLKVYQHKIINQIKSFAEPLNTFFEIDEFVYSFISNQGEFFSVSNQPEASEFYFSSNLYLSNPLIRHPQNYQEGFLFPGDINVGLEKQIMQEKFGYAVDSSFVIFKKHEEGIHKFLFNTKNKQFSLKNFYLNNHSLFHKFCIQFLNEFSSLTTVTEKYKINIGTLIGSEFHTKNLLRKEYTPDLAKKVFFLKSIGSIPMDFNLPKPFSPQEKICIEWILEGKTYKEIAEIMQLSYRTVEHYFENIKDKTGCLTKSETLENLHSLKILGVI